VSRGKANPWASAGKKERAAPLSRISDIAGDPCVAPAAYQLRLWVRFGHHAFVRLGSRH
jgi:hypothetical protein